MDFSVYVGKLCKVEISNGNYFKGKILTANDDEISLIDINGKNVSISHKMILMIREVNN